MHFGLLWWLAEKAHAPLPPFLGALNLARSQKRGRDAEKVHDHCLLNAAARVPRVPAHDRTSALRLDVHAAQRWRRAGEARTA